MAELDARRAEVLGSAAAIIQRRIRTHIAHRQINALRNSSIFLQAFCRREPLTSHDQLNLFLQTINTQDDTLLISNNCLHF